MKNLDNSLKINFDCTQLISFKWHDGIQSQLSSFEAFQEAGFEIIQHNDIWPVKKKYFQTDPNEYFIELFEQEFGGDFREWEDFNKPTLQIEKFYHALIKVITENKGKIENFKVFMCSLAQEGKTTDAYMSIKLEGLLKALYTLSWHSDGDGYHGTDNLIIEILD